MRSRTLSTERQIPKVIDRNYLKGREGDRINALLAGAGYNNRLVLKWLRLLCAFILEALRKTWNQAARSQATC